MSVVRLGNQKVIAHHVLEGRMAQPRRLISTAIDDLLWELEREAGAGERVEWATLRLSVEGTDLPVRGLKVRATVDKSRDDLVGMMTAVALAEHERRKAT